MTNNDAFELGLALGIIQSASWIIWRWVDDQDGDYTEFAAEFDDSFDKVVSFVKEAVPGGSEPVHPE